jgi:hypothetical protein
MARKSKRANVVTMIPGYSENSSSGGTPRNSAIPGLWDNAFHGDNRRSLPSSLSSALGSKSLEEYSSRDFPNYRVRTGLNLSFETNGETISSTSVSQERSLSPITLERESSTVRNLLSTLDGSDGFLPANQKGRYFRQKEVGPINGVEGLRASLVYGGNDTYLIRAKQAGFLLSALFPGAFLSKSFANYWLTLPAFYAFLDVVFMADGATFVRVWDASRYPAHALYLGTSQVDRPPFREGTEWTTDGRSPAFDEFSGEGVSVARTPFRPLAPLYYKNDFDGGNGPHPVMREIQEGTTVTRAQLENNFSSPLFPDPLN